MANVLSTITAEIQGAVIDVLRAGRRLPTVVSRDYDGEAAQKGSHISVPFTSAMSVNDIRQNGIEQGTSSGTSITPQDVTPSALDIQLNNWKFSQFRMSAKDIAEIQNGYPPVQLREAVKAVVNQIENDLVAMSHQAVNGIDAATTGEISLQEAANAQRYLNDWGSSPSGRVLAMSPQAYSEMLGSTDFANAGTLGVTEGPRVTGSLTTVVGFEPFYTNGLPRASYTAGTALAARLVDGAQAVGDNVIATKQASGAASTIQVGDVVQFGGTAFSWTNGATRYRVTDATNAMTTGSITIAPGLEAAVADNARVFVAPNRAPFALAFHPDAMALVMRPTDPNIGEGQAVTITDDVSRVTLQVRQYGEHYANRWSVSALYGVAMVDPRRAVQIYG